MAEGGGSRACFWPVAADVWKEGKKKGQGRDRNGYIGLSAECVEIPILGHVMVSFQLLSCKPVTKGAFSKCNIVKDKKYYKL